MHPSFRRRWLWSLASITLGLGLAVTTQAQTPAGELPLANQLSAQAGTAGTEIFWLPTVSVTQFETTVNSGMVSGSFIANNGSQDVLGGLRYQVSLLEPKPELATKNTLYVDNGLVFDRQIMPEVFSLAPDENQLINFNYALPAVPTGTYRLNLRVLTGTGEGLGWSETTIQAGGDNGFMTLAPGTITAGQEVTEALAGPTVDAGAVMQLAIKAYNPTTKPVTGMLKMDIYKLDVTGENIDPVTGETVTVQPQASTDIVLTANAPSEPGTYLGRVTALNTDNARVAGVADFRWVVRGEGATVLLARFHELSNDLARIQAEMVGPADGVSTVSTKVNAKLFEGEQLVGEQTTESMALGAGSRSAYFEFALAEKLMAPRAVITLTKEDGTVLDTHTVEASGETGIREYPDARPADWARPAVVKNTVAALQSDNLLWVSLVGAIGLVLVVVLVTVLMSWRKKKKNQTNMMPPLAVILLLAGIAAGVVSIHTAGAQSGDYPVYATIPDANDMNEAQVALYYFEDDDNQVWGYVNQPEHDEYYPNWDSIPFEADLHWSRCRNQAGEATAVLKYLATGGKVNPADSPNGNWQEVARATQVVDTSDRACGTPMYVEEGGHWVYDCSLGVITANLSLSPLTADNTTLWLEFSARNTYADDADLAYIWSYLWLNKQEFTECSDNEDNDGDSKVDCDDPGCHPGDNETLACDPSDNTENQLPYPDITATGDKINMPVQLDGSGSWDPDGAIAGYSWTVKFGSTFVSVNGSREATANFVPTVEGPYLVRLTVTDNSGDSVSTTANVNVTKDGVVVEQLPVPVMLVNNVRTDGPGIYPGGTQQINLSSVDEPVSLDGSLSTNPLGGELAYRWKVHTDTCAGTALVSRNDRISIFGGTANDVIPVTTAKLAPGNYGIRLITFNNDGSTLVCRNVEVRVGDADIPTTTPVLTTTPTPTVTPGVDPTPSDPPISTITVTPMVSPTTATTVPPVKPQCDDNEDNDGDGLVDSEDPGCYWSAEGGYTESWDMNDNDETNPGIQPSAIIER